MNPRDIPGWAVLVGIGYAVGLWLLCLAAAVVYHGAMTVLRWTPESRRWREGRMP